MTDEQHARLGGRLVTLTCVLAAVTMGVLSWMGLV
jgi:hypothetical protein